MTKKKAGGVPPIDEPKALALVLKMCPEVKGDSLQNALVNLLTEYNRLKVAPKTVGGEVEIMAGIKRIEDSLKQMKEQFSIMRQYGVGAKG